MKVIIFGCQQIAVDFIKYLVTLKDIQIPLICTYELPLDKTYEYKSVVEESLKLGLNVKNPSNINDSIINEVTNINPDIIFSVYYRNIFPKKLLKIPRLGCVNIHPSLLPDYKGPTPTAWAIQNCEKEFGITIHQMDEGIDTGDILVQNKFEIQEDETGYELYTRGMVIGAGMLIDNFYNIINQRIKPRKQEGIGSYYGKRKARYTIDWQNKAEDIKNLIRVHARPYNPVETLLFNRYIIINKAKVVRDIKYIPQGAGKIVDILDNDRLVVSCVDGCLLLLDYDIFPELSDMEKEIYFRIGNKFG